MWQKYVWERQTLFSLSKEIGYNQRWLQKQFTLLKIKPLKTEPCQTVIVADTTYFGRNEGICIFYSPVLKKVIAYSIIAYERASTYIQLRRQIEQRGFDIQAVVLDGRKGIREVFSDLPVQMCQFHQIMILRRYLTQNPRLESAKELKIVCKTLCEISKDEFIEAFSEWNEKWSEFLNEKTHDEDGKWRYTHRKIRSARRSIVTNLPYLFTYQIFPGLEIPNTTNCVESINSKLKELTRIHRGYNVELKHKIIAEILSK